MVETDLTQCQCEEDKFCTRYNREMRGRFREICQGINIDIGTATVFKQQWLRESNIEDQQLLNDEPIPLLLKTDQMPGDAVAMTAAIYSLHKAFPKKYITAVESIWSDVFLYNPDVVPISSIPNAKPIHMHYPAIHTCNDRGIHFMQGWTEFLSAVLGVKIPLLTNKPHLYFNDPQPNTENYWIICSGGKQDFTTKLWGHHNYQEVVTRCSDITFIQVGEKVSDHPRLRGTEDMVNKTTLRQLFDLVRRARGVVCGISLLMHVAAALDKPAIVIAGGREPVQWNSYPKQQYVHTVGALQCKSVQGHIGQACWRSRTVPLYDDSNYDKDTCERPINNQPLCMQMIKPEEIAHLILRYNEFTQ